MSPSTKQRLAYALACVVTIPFFWWLHVPTYSPTGSPTPPKATMASPIIEPSRTSHYATGGVTPAEKPDALARALSATNFKHRARRFERLGASLGAGDLETAFRTLKILEREDDREAFIRGLFTALAFGEPVRAMLASKRLPDIREKDAALTALVGVWNSGSNAMFERELRLTYDNDPAASLGIKLIGRLVEIGGKEGTSRPDLLVLWAWNLTEGKDRLGLLIAAAQEQYGQNPALAESYGKGLVGEDLEDFKLALLVWKPSEVAWQEIELFADPDRRTQAKYRLIGSWNEADPALAASYLAKMPGGTRRTNAVEYIAANYCTYDNKGAWAWADTLSGQEAEKVQQQLAFYATPMLGATFKTDADGYPIVDQVAPNTAAETAKLRPGDRLVGVEARKGGMVNVQRMDLSDVKTLVSGPEDSLLRMQVSPSLPGGGYGAPQTVQVTRRPYAKFPTGIPGEPPAADIVPDPVTGLW